MKQNHIVVLKFDLKIKFVLVGLQFYYGGVHSRSCKKNFIPQQKLLVVILSKRTVL